jgi:hypothetical protein
MPEPQSNTFEITIPEQDRATQEAVLKALRQAMQTVGVPFTVSCRVEEAASPAEPEIPADVYISPLAFLRSMAVLLWSSVRHPFSTTTIDLATGHIVSESQTVKR